MRQAAVRRSATLFVVIALGAAGCSGTTEETTPETSPFVSTTTSAADLNAERLAMMAEMYGIDPVPEVEVVREITPDEQRAVQAQCMTEQGFPPDDAGIFTVPAEQTDAMNLALYRCTAMYPIAERYLQPLSEDQLTALYTYYVESLVPCLRDQGHAPGEPPTLDTFLATLGSAQEYSPYHAVAVDMPETLRLLEVCPERPPVDQLYGP